MPPVFCVCGTSDEWEQLWISMGTAGLLTISAGWTKRDSTFQRKVWEWRCILLKLRRDVNILNFNIINVEFWRGNICFVIRGYLPRVSCFGPVSKTVSMRMVIREVSLCQNKFMHTEVTAAVYFIDICIQIAPQICLNTRCVLNHRRLLPPPTTAKFRRISYKWFT